MAAGKHPITIPPVRPLYRFAATGLGASMWFFVVDVPREERWTCVTRLETPMGPLNKSDGREAGEGRGIEQLGTP
ncbi:hypothetical protein VTL71DRAFT_15962 [Oculimacula yallundae]|uniref:Uncharacterized protein n=1 Tax=Oculimacula yallundae TaxID=86028 RepID=A0ABR4CFD0_9HELO